MCWRILTLLCSVIVIAVNSGMCALAQNDENKPTYEVLNKNRAGAVAQDVEPVLAKLSRPEPLRRIFAVPTVKSVKDSSGETIELRSDQVRVLITIDPERIVRISHISAADGRNLLTKPCECVLPVRDGSIVGSAVAARVESWMPGEYMSFAEAEFSLKAPEPITWRVRIYRDKPYIEQTFSVPGEWLTAERGVVQVLDVSKALRPVMPQNVFGAGFADGRPKINGRHRFEYVKCSDHLSYDANTAAGLAGFVADIGGQEQFTNGQVALIAHGGPTLQGKSSLRFLLWPFTGPVERGFAAKRRFIADEYSCQGDKLALFSWNQFWLWQGMRTDWEVVTAKRLMEILPRVAAVGCEELHLDAGWESTSGSAEFAKHKFPNGFEPIREFLRSHGMRYHTWLGSDKSDDPEVLNRLIDETDLCKIFMDRIVSDKAVMALREVRKTHPDFETFVHGTTTHSICDSWGDMHFLSDFNQVYFGEGQFWAWSAVLPDQSTDPIQHFYNVHSLRAGDLITRSAVYQVNWVWPYKCIVPPHYGIALFEDRPVPELVGRIVNTLASRYDFQWGFDPRMLPKEVLDSFKDWASFFKAIRPYLQDYQHVLAVPDGVNPDGTAHIVDGEGFVFLFNPGNSPAKVQLQDILWEPELGLDPAASVQLTDWSKPLTPHSLQKVNVGKPSGSLEIPALSYRVIGIDVPMDQVLREVKRQRANIAEARS